MEFNQLALKKIAEESCAAIESSQVNKDFAHVLHTKSATKNVAVVGITGTGGAGKSSLTDELIRRVRLAQNDSLRVAVISIDPSRRKSGGALLGDRIRMNAISPWAPTLAASRAALPPEGANFGSAALREPRGGPSENCVPRIPSQMPA